LKWNVTAIRNGYISISRNRPTQSLPVVLHFRICLCKKFGNDLSTLVGKTIEMTGQVEKFCRPNISVRIVDQAQIKLVN